MLCAFDLIELDGEDLRWARLEDRKHTLADLLRGTDDGMCARLPNLRAHSRGRLPFFVLF